MLIIWIINTDSVNSGNNIGIMMGAKTIAIIEISNDERIVNFFNFVWLIPLESCGNTYWKTVVDINDNA